MSKPYKNKAFVDSILRIEKEQGLNRKLIYTFAEVESNFTPLLITINIETQKVETLKKALENLYGSQIQIKSGSYPKNALKTIINVTAEREDVIVNVARNLFKAKIENFDMGIMQVNVCNIKNIDEITTIFNLHTNMEYASRHISSCWKQYGNNPREVVECYNKGSRPKLAYDYFARFEKVFYKNFN